MAGNTEARREALALALARGFDVRTACADVKVAERTARLWREDPAFTARIRQLRAEMFAEAVGKLAAVNGKAADTLARLLDSDNEKVALAAARGVLELGARLREVLDLHEQLQAHESRLAALEGGGDGECDTEEGSDASGGQAPPIGGVEGPESPGAGGDGADDEVCKGHDAS
jgi:hypothetical protein